MDAADDADGRVAVFSIDAVHRPDIGGPPPPPADRRPARDGPAARLWTLLDSAYAGVGIAIVLVVILVLGLLVARH